LLILKELSSIKRELAVAMRHWLSKISCDYKIQHQAYEKNQELVFLIVAELSFDVHFVALPSPRFTYGNHTATLALNLSTAFRPLRAGPVDALARIAS